MSVFGAVARTASTQHGAISRAQLRSCGLTDQQLRTWCARGVLVRDQPGVYLVASHPATWEQRLTAVTLAAGPLAVVSHRSAAGLWRLDRFRRQHLDLTVPGRARRSKLAQIHESTELLAGDRTVIDGIPVTTAARTIIDLGRYLSVTRLAALLDDAVRRDLTTYEQVHRRFGQLARQGRRGATTIRQVLAERPTGTTTPDSPLEDLVRRVLVAAGLPEPVLQHRVVCDDITYVLDLAWPEALVALECDGFRFHRTPQQLAWDDERRNRLGLRGWLVLHTTWKSARSDPTQLIATVRGALERR